MSGAGGSVGLEMKLLIRVAEAALSLFTGGPMADLLAVGSVAPAFSLPSTTGQVESAALAGKNVVLCFYPADDTPG